MKIHEKGVLPESSIFFHIPAESSRRMFLTLSSSGRFFCDADYRVNREYYGGYLYNEALRAGQNNKGSYLCLFVKRGRCFVYQNGRRIILSKNDVFLLNCYQPHCYGTQSGSELEVLWVHFDGAVVRNYFNQTAKNTNCTVLKSLTPDRFRTIYDNLYTIYNNFEKQQDVNDILNNKYLVAVMTEFLLESFAVSGKNSRSWDSLIIYISENVKKPLKLADLAERMALSPYHFIRQFKKRTGYTPHQYILMTRINTAIYLLQHTDLSVKEIAFSCGFSRVGAFCNAFKRMMDVWPMTYRTAASE